MKGLVAAAATGAEDQQQDDPLAAASVVVIVAKKADSVTTAAAIAVAIAEQKQQNDPHAAVIASKKSAVSAAGIVGAATVSSSQIAHFFASKIYYGLFYAQWPVNVSREGICGRHKFFHGGYFVENKEFYSKNEICGTKILRKEFRFVAKKTCINFNME